MHCSVDQTPEPHLKSIIEIFRKAMTVHGCVFATLHSYTYITNVAWNPYLLPTIIWNGESRLAVGGGTCRTIASSKSAIFFASSEGVFVKVDEAHPSLAEA